MTTQRYEIDTWLGDDWTGEQRDQIAADYLAWEASNPDTDADEREAMLTAIAQDVDGTLDLAVLVAQERAAVDAAVSLKRALVAAVIRKADVGVSELELERRTGYSRQTIRKWRGK